MCIIRRAVDIELHNLLIMNALGMIAVKFVVHCLFESGIAMKWLLTCVAQKQY